MPRIPGAELPHVFTGAKLRRLVAPLARLGGARGLRAASRLWMPLGRRVAVVGADLAALELAGFLASRGRRVTVVEAGDALAPEVGPKRRAEHMDALDRLGVAVNTGLRVERIAPGELVATPERGAPRTIAADSVVLAGELAPDTALFEAAKDCAPQVFAVGDCTGLGLIRKATEDATRAVAAL